MVRTYDDFGVADALAIHVHSGLSRGPVRKHDVTGMDTTDLLINVIGFVATLFAIFMWVPQARITWQNRNNAQKLAGVSETTQWLSAGSYLLWGVFGALSESFWVMAPSLISFPLSVATIVVVRRGRRLPPLTKSIPIIPMTTESISELARPAPLAVDSATTAPIPIVSSGTAASVGTSPTPGEYSATGPIPVLA